MSCFHRRIPLNCGSISSRIKILINSRIKYLASQEDDKKRKQIDISDQEISGRKNHIAFTSNGVCSTCKHWIVFALARSSWRALWRNFWFHLLWTHILTPFFAIQLTWLIMSFNYPLKYVRSGEPSELLDSVHFFLAASGTKFEFAPPSKHFQSLAVSSWSLGLGNGSKSTKIESLSTARIYRYRVEW